MCNNAIFSIRNWSSGGFRLGPGGTGPQILPRPPKFLIGSIVISLSRCCLPNNEGPGPQMFFFPRTATELISRRYFFSSSSCCCCCWDKALQESLRFRRFKSDGDEIRQNCSLRKYPLINIGFFIWRQHFQDGGHDVHLPLAYAQRPPASPPSACEVIGLLRCSCSCTTCWLTHHHHIRLLNSWKRQLNTEQHCKQGWKFALKT